MVSTLTWSTTLVKVDCCSCGIIFGVPWDLDEHNRADPDRWFYCPNGHSGPTEAQRLREDLARARRQRDQAESARRAARDQADAAERSAAAYKGQATRLRKRASAGVCPCCHRSFRALRDHMESQHPDFADDDASPEAPDRCCCPDCGRDILVNADGRLRYHRARGGRTCKGSRKAAR